MFVYRSCDAVRFRHTQGQVENKRGLCEGIITPPTHFPTHLHNTSTHCHKLLFRDIIMCGE